MTVEWVDHTLEPWFDNQSQILILGTIPSPKSREYGCYYGHPQNRFWKTLAAVFEEQYPENVAQRREFCRNHRIALWDVLSSCRINGAEDASIDSPTVNDIACILNQAPIHCVFTTGKKAKELYDRLVFPKTGIEAVALPSTSPANRRWFSEERLVEEYRIVRDRVL